MSRNSSQVSQNCDNFISDRSSTRLHAPPGGGSTVGSLIFGGGNNDAPTAPVSRRRSFSNKSNVQSESVPERTCGIDLKQNQSLETRSQVSVPGAGAGQVSSNSFANGASQNTGNVLTDRRSTRVHAPPGGKSSFTLG